MRWNNVISYCFLSKAFYSKTMDTHAVIIDSYSVSIGILTDTMAAHNKTTNINTDTMAARSKTMVKI